jgi:probable DNA metabolism protein
VAPDAVSWRDSEAGASLFGDEVVEASAGAVSLPRELLGIAERVICHRDAEVPARLYRIIWRAARDRQLLARTTDPDVDWLMKADKTIRRDVHKMHAFVRFRRLGEDEAGRESFAAWFEPDHRILRITAPFFQRRFYGMDWAIVTPDARAIWQAETLNYGPGARKMRCPTAMSSRISGAPIMARSSTPRA